MDPHTTHTIHNNQGVPWGQLSAIERAHSRFVDPGTSAWTPGGAKGAPGGGVAAKVISA